MRHAARLAAFACLCLPALAEPFQHSSGEWREYNRDWLAVCPDAIEEDAAHYYGYSCFASTGSQALNQAGLPAYRLSLIRNRLDGTLDVAITVAPYGAGYDQTRPLIVRLPGTGPIVLSMGGALETRHNSPDQFFITDSAARDRLVAAMKERAALTLSIPLVGKAKPVDIRMSLQGVMASLDFMATYARKVAQY